MVICIIYTLILLTVLTVKDIQADRNYLGYLDRAANANTMELCKKELYSAIAGIEEKGLTKGYTSVLWTTPDEDVEFWYTNITACKNELLKVTEETSQLERTNILMKIRESLTTRGNDSSKVIYPEGISKFPHNAVYGILLWLLLPVWSVCIGIWLSMYQKEIFI